MAWLLIFVVVPALAAWGIARDRSGPPDKRTRVDTSRASESVTPVVLPENSVRPASFVMVLHTISLGLCVPGSFVIALVSTNNDGADPAAGRIDAVGVIGGATFLSLVILFAIDWAATASTIRRGSAARLLMTIAAAGSIALGVVWAWVFQGDMFSGGWLIPWLWLAGAPLMVVVAQVAARRWFPTKRWRI